MKQHLAKAFSVAAAVPLLAIGLMASAQTTGTGTTSTGMTGTTGTGVYNATGTTGTNGTGAGVTAPNTGAGASAPFNVALIGASVLVLGAGALYLSRERIA